MTRKILVSVFLLAAIPALFSFNLPDSWFKAGSKPKSYEMGIDSAASQNGKNAATIKSIVKKIDGFGTLMQESLPGKFRGKRVRMTGYLKSENVTDWAGLWLRVDQPGSQQSLSFDNMANRAVKGTTDWKKYEIVVDVPERASMLAYGALLSGTGQIWFDNLTFEIVDVSVELTGSSNRGSTAVKTEPTNLDFETK